MPYGRADCEPVQLIKSRSRALLVGATPPFLSQITFSAASFFAMAGLAREFSTHETAAAISAYSLESVAVSWGNARWAALLVNREAEEPRSGDIRYMSRRFSWLAMACLPLWYLAAFVVSQSVTSSLAVAAWSSAMLFADLWRFAGSRFLGAAPVSTIGFISAGASIVISFAIEEYVPYLVILAFIACVQGLGYQKFLLQGREEGVSGVWVTDVSFARSLSLEALLTSSATGLAGAAISVINPVLAIALQIGNQILTMPSNMIIQAISLPLIRRLRERLHEGVYPSLLLLKWVAMCVVTPVVGAGFLWILRPLVDRLMGHQADVAFYFMPVILLQTLIITGWQPLTTARRWTHGALSTTVHIAVTVAIVYAGMVGVALIAPDEWLLLVVLICVLSAVLTSVLARGVAWMAQGRKWQECSGVVHE